MWALWEAVGDLDEFCLCLFDSGELSGASPDAGGWSGLWVYEVEYEDPGDASEDQEPNTPEFWAHLHDGDFRRPTPEELAQVNGSADGPWKVVL
jgi:hypothetical protein